VIKSSLDMAQVLLALLFLYPDEPPIPIKRTWIALWYADVTTALELLQRL
jgi:hypothetical protein